ncbi:hypothetical protein V5O48_012520, partial [Marasmius crinis-equi]
SYVWTRMHPHLMKRENVRGRDDGGMGGLDASSLYLNSFHLRLSSAQANPETPDIRMLVLTERGLG